MLAAALRRPARTARSPSSSSSRRAPAGDRAALRAGARRRGRARRCGRPGRHAGQLQRRDDARRHTVVYGDIDSTLDLAQAKGYTERCSRALGRPPGVEHVYVTGAAAIQHDLDPVFNRDLKHGELEIAVPIALLVLLAVFGLSWAVTIPLIFAACTIMGTLGIVYGVAQLWATPTYATNLVQLIGLGIAVDYSLLIVYRFREELARGQGGRRRGRADDADGGPRGRLLRRSPSRSGSRCSSRCRCRSSACSASPGFLIPIVSIVGAVDAAAGAALLLRPPRHGAPAASCPASRSTRSDGFWARLARSIMARPLALPRRRHRRARRDAAVPAFWLQVTPGSTFGIPRTSQSVRGFDLLRAAVGPGAVAPAQIARRRRRRLGARAPPTQAAVAAARRLARARPRGREGLHAARGPLRRPDAAATSRCSSPAATTTASRRSRRSSSGCATS